VVESTALEMRRAGNRTVGSNPTLSASLRQGFGPQASRQWKRRLPTVALPKDWPAQGLGRRSQNRSLSSNNWQAKWLKILELLLNRQFLDSAIFGLWAGDLNAR
jgi:hypothetical protein